MSPPIAFVRRHRAAVAAFLLAAGLVLARIGSLPLIDPDEGRNAEIARELAASGDWLVPTYDGLAYLDKPILYLKAVALSLEAFGRSEAAARLPSAACGLALLAVVFAFCRREFGERDAALAVVVVVTCPLFLVLSRYVIFDMPLALFVCSAILAGYRAESETGGKRRAWYAAGAAAAGVATLLKGPVGFVVPFLVLAVFALAERRPRAIQRLLSPLNLVVFLAVVLPWFVGVTLRRPDFLYYGIVDETLKRFTTTTFHRNKPFWFYLPVMIGACFAWSVLFPEAAVAAWRARRQLTRGDRFSIVWAVSVMAFFSTSHSKLVGYVLPAVVPLGILIARLFGAGLDDPRGTAGRVVRHGTVALVGVGAFGAALLAAESVHPGLFAAWFGAHGREFEALPPVFPWLALALAVVAAAAIAGRLAETVRLSFTGFVLLPASLLTIAFGGLSEFAAASSSRPLARRVDAIAPGLPTACLECYPEGISFYSQRLVTVVTRDGSEFGNYVPFTLARQADWPDHVVRRERFDGWLATRHRDWLLMASDRHRATLDSLAARRGGRVVALAPGWWGLVTRAGGS